MEFPGDLWQKRLKSSCKHVSISPRRRHAHYHMRCRCQTSTDSCFGLVRPHKAFSPRHVLTMPYKAETPVYRSRGDMVVRMAKVMATQRRWHVRLPHWPKKKTGSSFYCFIFGAKKFTAAILVRPLCCESSVCKSTDKTSMARIAARILY